jgi:hypothetical protein
LSWGQSGVVAPTVETTLNGIYIARPYVTNLLTVCIAILNTIQPAGIALLQLDHGWLGLMPMNNINTRYSKLWARAENNVIAQAILQNRLIPIKERLDKAEKELNNAKDI